MHETQFWIPDDGIRLNAKLTRPSEGSQPLAILIHGFTGHMEEPHMLALVDTFNALGFATLRADLYGHGQSGGRFHDHTLYKWLTNVLTLIDYARSLDFVTGLTLCGHSQGGLAVMLAAAMKRDQVDRLIPLAPAAMIPEGARRGELLGRRFDPDHIPDTLNVDEKRTLGGNYIRVAQTLRVEDAIDRYPGPVLIVHGDADATVPVQVGIDAAGRYRDARLALIHGDSHCFDFHLDQMLAAIRDWLSPAS